MNDDLMPGVVVSIGVVALITIVAIAVDGYRTGEIVHDCKAYGKYEYQTDKWLKCEVEK